MTGDKVQKKKAREQLAGACAKGDLPAIKRLLSSDKSLAEDWRGIMNASFAGHADIVAELIRAGANPNILSPTSHHHRPLHRAVEFKKTIAKTPGHSKVVEALLSAGADPLSRGTWCGVTAIAAAAMAGAPQLLAPMLKRVPKPDIFTAAVSSNVERVRYITNQEPGVARLADRNGYTALAYCAASRLGKADRAAAHRLKEIAEILIECGADVHAAWMIDRHPMNVMGCAAGNRSVLDALLKNGADPTQAVRSALWDGDYDTADMLALRGAKFTDPRIAEGVPEFARWSHYTQSRWLIDHGAPANAIDKDQRTALHWACARGASVDFIHYLLDHGAERSLRDANGDTPIDVARQRRKEKIVAALTAKHPAKRKSRRA
jgi:ankyrin repeat protein